MSEHVEVLRYMRDPATQSEAELAAIDAAIAALSACHFHQTLAP